MQSLLQVGGDQYYACGMKLRRNRIPVELPYWNTIEGVSAYCVDEL